MLKNKFEMMDEKKNRILIFLLENLFAQCLEVSCKMDN